MSSPRPRPDPNSAPSPVRPPIWVNGRQRPAFDIRAYGAYSLIATRAVLGPALTRVAASTEGLQGRILAGAFEINTARLGRAGAYLPKRTSVAATVGGLALTLKDAAEVVVPPPPPVESLAAYDALWRTRKVPASGRLRGNDLDAAQSDPLLRALRDDTSLRPARPTRPVLVHSAPEGDAPLPPPDPIPPPAAAEERGQDLSTLLAIRSMLREPDAPDTLAPQPMPAPQAAPIPTGAKSHPLPPRPRKPLPAWTRPLGRALRRGIALTLGWGLTVTAMPIGLTKAAIAHLNGRDLRDLVEDP